MPFVKIGDISDFPEGKMKKIEVQGKELLVANVKGQISSIDGICTHEECSLADGFLKDEIVTCPCHMAQFNVKTGKNVARPATGESVDDEPTFNIKIENNQVFVEV